MSTHHQASRRSTSVAHTGTHTGTSQRGHSHSQSASSRHQTSVKDGYAAIDFGSTSTRAYLTTVHRKTKQMNGYRVQKTGVDDDKKKRFLRGEWPSKGCPFDAPYPVGYAAAGREHADKRDRSLKSFVWFLADEDDQHPYTRDLKDHHDSLHGYDAQKEFRRRLMSMLVKHLTIVADQIVQEAALRQTTIRRLVFCVPNAWDKPNFQHILRPIMDKVARGIETYCVFESEALSQFILHQHSYILSDQDFALVCDFGGHFMGGSLFQFCRDSPDDDHPAFFSLPQGNFGIRGGSQLWEDHVRPYIDAQLANLRLPADRENVLRAKFLDAFFISKIEVDASFYEKNMSMRLVVSITDAFPDDTNLYPLYLKPAQIRSAWEKGFRTSIDMAIDKIRLLPVSSRGKTVVILSGGSMQNYQARTEIQQKCKDYGIECQAVGFDVNVESSKWMVCEGAATSEALALSAQEFFQRGAALAIQSYTRDGKYKTDANVVFYGVRDSPRVSMSDRMNMVEYDVGAPVEIEFTSHAHNRFRLVCDPLYQRNSHRYPPGCISILSDDATENNNCYDVWDMSRHTEGKHAAGANANATPFSIRLPLGKYLVEVDSMEYHENTVDATLRLRMTRQIAPSAASHTKKPTLRGRTAGDVQEAYTFDVPLTSCGPSNLVLLDLDLVKKRVWKPVPGRGTQLPASQSATDPTLTSIDPELDFDDEDDAPPAKRQRFVASPRIKTPVEPLATGWQARSASKSRTYDQINSRGASVTPYIAKQDTNTGSPLVGGSAGFTLDQDFTFELEGPDSDSDYDARSNGTVESEVPDHRIDFAAFPISSSGVEKKDHDGFKSVRDRLPTPDA